LDNAFDLLEQRVRRAAEAIKRLQGENQDLKKQLGKAEGALQQAGKALEAAERQSAKAASEGPKVEALGRELTDLRKERDDVRRRIARLVEVLDGLD
jgi:chromosome segregation ATPase